jgi:glyoxylase-like metal-dependent hydrolase (beta-lactamase superfamily II)
VVLDPVSGLLRLTAPNPGLMTGPGTNSYVLGRSEVAVIDPGPDDEGHRAALLAAIAARGTLRWILVTHTHRDHAPGAAKLAEATGARTVGFATSTRRSTGWPRGTAGSWKTSAA